MIVIDKVAKLGQGDEGDSSRARREGASEAGSFLRENALHYFKTTASLKMGHLSCLKFIQGIVIFNLSQKK